MTAAPQSTDLRAWHALQAHYELVKGVHLREIFADDPTRSDRMQAEGAGLYLDYSKNRINDETITLLGELAREAGLEERRDAMFQGEKINVTEQRAALHVALRAARGTHLYLDGHDVVPAVHEVLGRMAVFADAVRNGRWLGYTSKRIRNVVNIGIGGSYLGPGDRVSCPATVQRPLPHLSFRRQCRRRRLRGEHARPGPERDALHHLLQDLRHPGDDDQCPDCPAWVVDRWAAKRPWAGTSWQCPRTPTVREFGIDTDNMFVFWDWVGGRYSMDSAIGLSTMMAVGPENFDEMLAGFHAMDEHFRTAPFENNLPALMGLLTVWYSNFFGARP